MDGLKSEFPYLTPKKKGALGLLVSFFPHLTSVRGQLPLGPTCVYTTCVYTKCLHIRLQRTINYTAMAHTIENLLVGEIAVKLFFV